MSPRTQCVMAPDRPRSGETGVYTSWNSKTQRERERERGEQRPTKILHTRQRVKSSSSSWFALPPQPLVLLPIANKTWPKWVFFFFFAFIVLISLGSLGLWERKFCVSKLSIMLCFCSDCGMFYFVTVEIKKREWRTIEKMDERERIIILFNRW